MNNPCIAIFFLILLFLGGFIGVSYASGWRELARYYRYQNESITSKKLLLWACLRWVSYKACLYIGANPQGVYLAVLSLFSAASPKLFIPWNDITINKKIFWGYPVFELRFAKAPTVTLMVSQKLGDFFQEASGRPLIIDD
jgi:hypothetical protein